MEVKKQKGTFYVADFETAPWNFDASIRKDLVFAWCLLNNKKQLKYGIDIKSFIETITTTYLKNSKYNKKTVYFHNNSKFDGHFLVKSLPSLGFIQRKFNVDKKIITTISKSPWKEKNIIKKRARWKDKEYEIFTGKTGIIYQIKISFKTPLTQKIGIITFLDSKLLFKTSIEKMGEQLNKFYNNKLFSKGDKNFKLTPYENVKELENDYERFAYLKQDCRILLAYLELKSSFFSRKGWKITIGATAYNNWKLKSADQLEKIYLKTNKKEWNKIYKNNVFYRYKWGIGKEIGIVSHSEKLLEKILPMKTINKNHQELRFWFSGGLCYLHPKKYGKIFFDIYGYDINSEYPNVMNSDRLFPIGDVFLGDGGKNYPIKFYKILAKNELINNDGLPFIPMISNGGSKFYPKTIPQSYIFFLTSPEFLRFKKYYVGEFLKETVFSFQAVQGKELFETYINFWYSQRKNNNSFQQDIAKIMLNSLFGKFGTKSEKENKIFNPNKQDENWDTLEPSEKTSWETEITINETDFYLPISCLITAYGRMMLVDAVAEKKKQFIYADTDSIWFNGDLLDHNLIGEKLGQWKREINNGKGIFFQKKGYDVRDEKRHLQRLKSYQLEKKLSWNQIIFGSEKLPYLRNQEVKWGKVLKPDFKILKAIWSDDKERPDDCWYKTESDYMNYFKQIKHLELKF